jgi:hypothetical protein
LKKGKEYVWEWCLQGNREWVLDVAIDKFLVFARKNKKNTIFAIVISWKNDRLYKNDH